MKKAKKIVILCVCFAVLSSLFMGFKAKAVAYKFNMSYIYLGNSSEYTCLVDNTQNSLNEVSPDYFALNSDGSLALTSAVSADFINDMHSRGIAVVPSLTNEWSRSTGQAALSNKEALSKCIADAVSQYNLDGVNIDIENVTSVERDAYVDFVQLLRTLLPEGKKIVVSVAANPSGLTTGWQGSYDYAALAEYCDYLMIMAYDEHFYGGEAGPVASMSFVENSIKYALSLIPKEKIVLGFPFYGRIWSDSSGYLDGYGVTNTKIAELVKNYSGSVQVDPDSQSTCAVISIAPGDTKPIIGGQVLDAGSYTIWYESENSIKAKLELVSKYDIKGTGNWALGQETENTWNYYKLWLNNCTFTDIQDNPSKDDILDAYLAKLINGCGDNRFSPDEPLTRAQAATILVRRLGLNAQLNPAYSFDDCVGTWAQAYVETARKYHIISGIGNNLFNPDKPVTREEVAVMINRALVLQNNNDGSSFTDVNPVTNPWSYDSIEIVAANGIMAGSYDGAFQPQASMTRAEATVLINTIPIPPASMPEASMPEISTTPVIDVLRGNI